MNLMSSIDHKVISLGRRIPEREVGGPILTRVTVMCPWARHIYLSKVLVIPRKPWLRPNMTEKLFTGTLRIKSTNQLTKWFQITSLYRNCLIIDAENWLKAIKDGKILGTVVVDFQKAFDIVDHDLLSQKRTL